jgi:hypothetical protein
VLKNLLGITSKREMDRMEGRAQVRVLEVLAGFYDSDHRFTAADICRMHRLWLGRIYPWAGRKEKGDRLLYWVGSFVALNSSPLPRPEPCRLMTRQAPSVATGIRKNKGPFFSLYLSCNRIVR